MGTDSEACLSPALFSSDLEDSDVIPLVDATPSQKDTGGLDNPVHRRRLFSETNENLPLNKGTSSCTSNKKHKSDPTQQKINNESKFYH